MSTASPRIPPLEEVLVRASTGPFANFVDIWIANTATAHIIDWRLEGALKVPVRPEYLVLPGGPTATQWVFDRFSTTYMDDWDAESLSWELSFASASERTAARAGIDLAILKERPAAASLAVEAIVRRHTNITHLRGSSSFGGVDPRQLLNQIVFLLMARDFEQAKDLARAAAGKAPHDEWLRNAYAFTLIPSAPADACSLLEGGVPEGPLKDLNVLSCLLAERRVEDAQNLVVKIRLAERASGNFWLWSPRHLLKLGASTVLEFYQSSEWLSEVEKLLNG